MPWSGGSFTRTNGVNTGATLWAQDRDDGTKILATRHDTNDQDMADGINSTLEKSGSNAATGNLDIGSNRITLVADGTAKTDVATVNQIQSNGPAFQATDTGTANTYVIALTPAITAYAAGQEITFKAGAASTTASTLNVNTLGAKALKKLHDQDIASGDIETGSIVTAVYDGTNFQVTSQLATEGGTPGGSDTQVQYNSSGSFAGDADLTFDGTELTAAGVNLAAFSGVLEANAAFVDQVIFGPSVDGQSWSGLWSKASVFSSLMLATVEDAGADSQINIWDLTTKDNTTPLGTVTLSGDATPTSIAACMGYIIVGSEDGISIIDPHSGAWAERTTGWPRSLSTSTTPALVDNDVQAVAATISDAGPYDPRTGGFIPTFACTYGTGAAEASIIKDDGVVYDHTSFTVSAAGAKAIGFIGQEVYFGCENTGDTIRLANIPISAIQADDWSTNNTLKKARASDNFLGCDGGSAFSYDQAVFADSDGLSIFHDPVNTASAQEGLTALVNRTYTTGFFPYDTKGTFLANSKTVDRSGNSNTLTESGTVTEGAVESSAELNGYSAWSTSNYLHRVNDADFAPTTNDFSVAGWFKATAGGPQMFFRYGVAETNTNSWYIGMNSDETIRFLLRDSAGTNVEIDAPGDFEDSKWHMFYGSVDRSADIMSFYIDGVVVGTASTASTASMTNTSQKLEVGIKDTATTPAEPATGSTLSLLRFSVTKVDATQVRETYDAEKGLFIASAECLLQSGSTDAVIDVDVDPLTSKVIVTQTDAITVFDGLVVDSKPTVNSGTSEKGKLWGDLRAEQNSANAYVTAPADDQRQVNEMVRGLASDMPGGVDLSKAKAWLKYDPSAIESSFNIKSVSEPYTGFYDITVAIPFKSIEYIVVGMASDAIVVGESQTLRTTELVRIKTRSVTDSGAVAAAGEMYLVWFGELENE